MPAFYFYYDETEHSRKINLKTVNAENYYDNFVTTIIGWSVDNDTVLQKYAAFEMKYEDRKDCNGETKSTMLQQKRFKQGFASLNKQNVQFVEDFLALFDENTHVYFSISSKIEYLICQLFQGYRNGFFINADAIKYSITKALVLYHPREIIQCLFESPNLFLDKLKIFFRERIEQNKCNPQLKQSETDAFSEILQALDDISDSPELSWDYHMPFDGFKLYLEEKRIQEYYLIIDKEGAKEEESRTLKAAKESGLQNVSEDDSRQNPGLRMADLLVGILSKLMKNLFNSLRYQSATEGTQKKLLSLKWFDLNEEQLRLYKKLYWLICEIQPAWYKSYSGIYADDLVVFIALLNFMNHFETAEEIKTDISMQGEYFNAFVCERMERLFEQRRCKFPIEPVVPIDNESYLDQRGEKVYFDSRKQPPLPLNEKAQIYHVLSVGTDRNIVPIITIEENGRAECFRLPDELTDWACTAVAMAVCGEKLFQADVLFAKIHGSYYADIL